MRIEELAHTDFDENEAFDNIYHRTLASQCGSRVAVLISNDAKSSRLNPLRALFYESPTPVSQSLNDLAGLEAPQRLKTKDKSLIFLAPKPWPPALVSPNQFDFCKLCYSIHPTKSHLAVYLQMCLMRMFGTRRAHELWSPGSFSLVLHRTGVSRACPSRN